MKMHYIPTSNLIWFELTEVSSSYWKNLNRTYGVLSWTCFLKRRIFTKNEQQKTYTVLEFSGNDLQDKSGVVLNNFS